MFDRIDRELRTQYLLGYYPNPAPPPGSDRHVEVKVKGDEWSATARNISRRARRIGSHIRPTQFKLSEQNSLQELRKLSALEA